jgi:hypothetical protein
VNSAFQEWVSSWLKGDPAREEVAKYFFEGGDISVTTTGSDVESVSHPVQYEHMQPDHFIEQHTSRLIFLRVWGFTVWPLFAESC